MRSCLCVRCVLFVAQLSLRSWCCLLRSCLCDRGVCLFVQLIFLGRLRAPAPPGPSDRGAAAWGIPVSQRPRGGGCACFSEFLRPVRSSESLLLPDLRFLTTKDRLHKPPPLATRFSVTQIAKFVKATYPGGELRPQKPTSTGAPPIHVPLQRRNPPSAPPCCLPELRANLSDIPNEER